MKLIRRFSRLNKTIEGYGYEYSPKKLLAFSLVLLVCSILMGYYYRLNYLSIAALSVFTILLFPSIINAQFRLLSNNESFEQLSNYMDHMIISFKKKKNDWESQSQSKRKGSWSGDGAARGRCCSECLLFSNCKEKQTAVKPSSA